MIEGCDETTHHVQMALKADERSLSWIVSHFTPLLTMEARYRVNRQLQGIYDPEDLVQQATTQHELGLGTVTEKTLMPRHIDANGAARSVTGRNPDDLQTGNTMT